MQNIDPKELDSAILPSQKLNENLSEKSDPKKKFTPHDFTDDWIRQKEKSSNQSDLDSELDVELDPEYEALLQRTTGDNKKNNLEKKNTAEDESLPQKKKKKQYNYNSFFKRPPARQY